MNGDGAGGKEAKEESGKGGEGGKRGGGGSREGRILSNVLTLYICSIVRPFQFDLLLLGRPGWWSRVGR